MIGEKTSCVNNKNNRKKRYAIWFFTAGFLLILFLPFISFADGVEPESDEVLILLKVPQVGIIEIPAIIKGQEIYLPVTDVFDFLKIKNSPSPGLDSITGFFITQQAAYIIDKTHNRITYEDKVFDLEPDDMFRTETNLFLKSDYFGRVFGLECVFNFRSLSVTLTTKLELPVIREMRLEQMRKNINRLKGEIKADTAINRSYPYFHFGTADWSAISTQQLQGGSNTRLNLALGAILAGGETKVSINYNDILPFTEKQQYYLWRFVNSNQQSIVQQVMVGKISSHAVSTIYSPVVGVQFTNTPTTYRRSFGSYVLSDYTEPGWIVELYVNNVLVDYVKADASGFFTFDVPLVYGNSLVKLRFYGLWGEEHTREQNIIIPYNFLPVHKFEYTVGGGMVEDSIHSQFTRANFNYGMARWMTVGGGVEYLSSVTSGSSMPFLNTSMRLAGSLLFSGEYVYGVRAKSILSYRLPSNLQFEINYIKYDKDQKAINLSQLEERNVMISMPFRTKKLSAFSRFKFNQIIFPTTKYSTAELMLSGVVFGMCTNFTTYGVFFIPDHPYIFSNLSLSFRFPRGFVVTPQAQYKYNDNELVFVKCGMEKRMFKHSFLNVAIERNFISNTNNFQIGFRYEFPFAQTSFLVSRYNNSTVLNQSAGGSLICDAKTSYIGFSNRSSVGKGGITILPYLDINCNGKRDNNEPKVSGFNFHINGGRIEKNKKDTIIRVFDLEPYTNYYIELDRNSFENIAWQLRKQTISVAIDPNQLKLIEVPIAVVGEASGMVFINGNGEKKGQGRIIVCFYDSDSSLVARTLTEEDGFFSFLGLSPGAYTVRIDDAQLLKLKMTATPLSLPLNIIQNKDGDVVDGLEFILNPQ